MKYITIGSDRTLELLDVRDGATGTALTSATVTYALYLTSTGAAVSSGTGSLAHSAGGDYSGVIESTVTSTLTANAQYHVIYTVAQSSYNAEFRDDFLAKPPGGGIIDARVWQDITGTTLATDAEEISCDRICAAVADALTRRCYPIALEPRTLTLFAFDAPPGNIAYTPLRPCRSISALYLRYGANGDSSTLVAGDLLTAYTDYVLDVDDPITNSSRSGRLIRRGSSSWGYELRRPVGRLGSAIDPCHKALFISGSFGPATVSPAVQEAAARCVTLLWNSREQGGMAQSVSWNSGSYSLAGAVTADAAINSPEVTGLLRSVGVLPIHVG